jgi:hypothetical protein
LQQGGAGPNYIKEFWQDMSFREKSLWLLLVSLIATFGLYFASVLRTRPVEVMPGHVALFAALVVLLVVSQIVGSIVIAIISKRTGSMDGRHATDERDRLIGLKSTRNAWYVLAAGVFLSLCLALLTQGNFVFTHVLLAFWVLAQLVEIGSQLILYRRSA